MYSKKPGGVLVAENLFGRDPGRLTTWPVGPQKLCDFGAARRGSGLRRVGGSGFDKRGDRTKPASRKLKSSEVSTGSKKGVITRLLSRRPPNIRGGKRGWWVRSRGGGLKKKKRKTGHAGKKKGVGRFPRTGKTKRNGTRLFEAQRDKVGVKG